MHSSSAIILSLVIVAAGLVAGVIPFFFQWSHQTAHRWIAFGAGSILGAAFLHMIPEAHELAKAPALSMVLAGFLLLYFIEQLMMKHPHDEDSGEFHEIGFLAFVGLTLHDIIDGIALGSGEHIPELTPAIFLALVLHKIPTTFSVSLLLLHGGYKRSRIVAFLLVMLIAIPAGVLLSNLIVGHAASAQMVGYLVAFSAGTFIYIGAYELLPEMHRKSAHDLWIAGSFAIGIAVMVALKFVHPVI
jgi:zinc and cadmium transporter